MANPPANSSNHHSDAMNPENQGASNWPMAIGLLAILGVVGGGMVLLSPKAPITPPENPSMKREAIQASINAMTDDAPVIGVVVNGQPKAYPIRFLMRPDQHAVNDLVAGTPVTVTFCDIDQCIRIFSPPAQENQKSEKMDIRVTVPHRDRPGKLLLTMGKTRFWQDNSQILGTQEKKIPLDLREHQQMTWGEWKAIHPTTECYQVKTID